VCCVCEPRLPRLAVLRDGSSCHRQHTQCPHSSTNHTRIKHHPDRTRGAVGLAAAGGGGAPGSSPLIVTLLDGQVVAVDRDAGEVLWTFDSGAPLVSAKQTQEGNGFNVFPGADGGLYAYHGMNHQRSLGLEVQWGSGWGWGGVRVGWGGWIQCSLTVVCCAAWASSKEEQEDPKRLLAPRASNRSPCSPPASGKFSPMHTATTAATPVFTGVGGSSTLLDSRWFTDCGAP